MWQPIQGVPLCSQNELMNVAIYSVDNSRSIGPQILKLREIVDSKKKYIYIF